MERGLKLWFIAATDNDAYNLDLFVWARNLPQARVEWMKYYDKLGEWPEDARVFRVPTDKPKNAGAVSWNTEKLHDLQTEFSTTAR